MFFKKDIGELSELIVKNQQRVERLRKAEEENACLMKEFDHDVETMDYDDLAEKWENLSCACVYCDELYIPEDINDFREQYFEGMNEYHHCDDCIGKAQRNIAG